MNIVADTNIFLAVILREAERSRIVRLTANATVLSPEFLPYEIGNALSAMVKRRKLTESQALEAEKAVGQIPVRLVSTNIGDSLRLAVEQNLYAYDAYFLSCAQAFSYPLLTLDRAMQRVATRLGIEVLE